MPNWRPLGTDANGVEEYFDTDTATVRRDYKGSASPIPVIEDNKRVQNNGDGYTPSRDLQRVASIPIWVIHKWTQDYGVDPTKRGNEVLLARLLNDPDWRWLRTGSGTLAFKERS